jgi:corrinoid protein of di/trimethylamine methyltransferase
LEKCAGNVSPIEEDAAMADIPEGIRQSLAGALREGNENEAEEVTRNALAAGVDPLDLIQGVLVPTLTKVGEEFQNFEIFLPELMLSGEAAKRAGSLLEAAIKAQGREVVTLGKVVIGTVEGDIHDIGQNIVTSLLSANGFEVVNLGRNVRPSAFLEAAEAEGADIVGMSALMTTTLPMQRRAVSLFEEVGVRDKYKMVVGGGAVSQGWVEEIGADGFALDAAAAVELCKSFLET